MAAAYAEDSSLIGHYSSAELRDVEIIFEINFIRLHLINIEEMNIFGSPLEVVHELARAVALFQDKGVLEELAEFFDHVYISIVGDAARELPQLPLFPDQIFSYLF